MPLTAKQVAAAGPGKYFDTRGLHLLVRTTGGKFWIFRYQINKARREMGIGSWPDVSLAKAREKTERLRLKVKVGIDPLQELAESVRMTVAEAADATIEAKRSGWRSPKQEGLWRTTLERYAMPKLGTRDVSGVVTADALAILKPIWTTKPETASRVRSRMETVLDYAGTLGAREGENPFRWKGNLENLLPRPTKVRPVRHHPALPYRDLPEFMVRLRALDGVAARCLAFIVLTAVRSGEARGAVWEEVDLERRVWTLPAERMKMSSEHTVPLSGAAVALLGDPGSGLVFPSVTKADTPLSDAGVSKVLKRLDVPVTVHGFRSTFRDWAGETTSHAREVVERCLAHGPQDRTEAAYARGDLLKRRRQVMEAWAAYCCGAPDKVLQLQPRKVS